MKPTDDELEQRHLHHAEIEMDRALHAEEQASRGTSTSTVLYDTAGVVHAGRLAAAIHTLRLLGGSVRRLLGRVGGVEDAADRTAVRLAVVEGTVVILCGVVALILIGVQASLTFALLCALYLWLVP